LLELARRNAIPLPAQTEAELAEFYRFRDFSHFVEVYLTLTGCLRNPEDFELVAYRFGADMARQNIRYAEATFSMSTNLRYTGLPWETILDSLNAGRKQAANEFGVDWRWVFDIVRNNPETQDEITSIAIAAQDRGVVALGLGGSEAEFPAGLFTQSFERARQAGLHRLPHAGETDGPQSVWDSLNLLHAERIGHGVRSIDDPALVAYLRDHQVPLEICPTSNVRLGVYPSYAAHPLRKLWEAGIFVCIASDDPPMFGTELNSEYQVLVEEFEFSRAELEQVSLNGIRASLLPQAEKDRLEAEFHSEFARLRAELEL
jgi:adenosine deaminase